MGVCCAKVLRSFQKVSKLRPWYSGMNKIGFNRPSSDTVTIHGSKSHRHNDAPSQFQEDPSLPTVLHIATVYGFVRHLTQRRFLPVGTSTLDLPVHQYLPRNASSFIWHRL
jgi:hypothetical protein